MDAPDPTNKKGGWPLAFLIGFLSGVGGAILAVPVSDWAMKWHHVSSMEGGRACAALGFWAPLGLIGGTIVGLVASRTISGNGFVGFLKRLVLALAVTSVLVLAGGGIGYATADHPPRIDGKNLALEIETRVPVSDGKTAEDLERAGFSVALVVSVSDRAYANPRWKEARREGEYLIVPVWAILHSSNARREITAGFDDDSRQIFDSSVPAAPKKIDESWSEWKPVRERFDHKKPAPNEQYAVRYRVRFADEYEPTPTPSSSSVEEATPTPGGSSAPTP